MVSEATDTIDTLLARYVAGALPLPARVLVGAHIELRPQSRRIVRELEHLAGLALGDEEPVQLSGRDRRIDAIFAASPPALEAKPAAGGVFPAALRDFVGFDADDVPWRTKLPGFREHEIGEFDGCQMSLFWIRPGRRIPTHTHGGIELTLVLDGAFTDIHGRYARGDISIADETVEHRPTAEALRPCIGLAVTDAPLRLTGPIGQRLSDIVRG